MFDQNFMSLPGITPQEYSYLQSATQGLNEQQLRTFLMVYAGKRKNPSDMLIFAIVGAIFFAGIAKIYNGTNRYGYFISTYLGVMLNRFNYRYC